MRHAPSEIKEQDNPAANLMEFLDDEFERIACGDVPLETTKAREHAGILAVVGPIDADLARKYIQYWKDTGFLC